MKRPPTDTNTPPDIPRSLVEWLQRTQRPRMPAIPPPETANPCERMALAAAYEFGRNAVVQAVVNAYRAQEDRRLSQTKK